MTALERILAQLKPLGIYRLEEGTYVYAELRAWYEGLRLVEESLRALEREVFLQTAEDRGLAVWEKTIHGRTYPELDKSERREMLLAALAVRPDGFSRGDMENALRAVGVIGEIEDNGEDSRLIVKATEYRSELTGYSRILEKVTGLLPAHLDIVLDMGVFSWAIFDSRDYTFDQWDSLELTFDEFENQGLEPIE